MEFAQGPGERQRRSIGRMNFKPNFMLQGVFLDVFSQSANQEIVCF
jgi:hypothetical protein